MLAITRTLQALLTAVARQIHPSARVLLSARANTSGQNATLVHQLISDWRSVLQVLPAKAHRIEAPNNVVETSVDELLYLYELMYKMRRMEIAADMMYKAKLIRGFCHL